MSGGFNPNAPSFNFVPGQPFVPRTQQQQQPQQQQGQPGQQGSHGGYHGQQQGYYGGQQQPFNPYSASGYGGPQPGYGGPPGGYQQPGVYNPYAAQQPGGFQPPQPRYSSPSTQVGGPTQAEQLAALPPKVLSLGGAKAAPSNQPFVRTEAKEAPKPAPSLSLGGGKPIIKPSTSGMISNSNNTIKPSSGMISSSNNSKPASIAPSVPSNAPPSSASSSTDAAASTLAAAAAAGTAVVPAAASGSVEPEKADKKEKKEKLAPVAAAAASSNYNFSTSKAKMDSDGVAAEAEKLLTEDSLQTLYGGKQVDAAAKTHLNVVFIGHVDAGKSTMGGQLLYLTGMVDKRTLEKFEKEAKEAGRESWYLSWALDSTPQERAKGKTVEVGRAYFETETRRYTMLDAPGHKTYVPSMISGAAQADVALLVISARKGEFEAGFDKGGQTREHAQLVKTAGVTKLIVVVNKMDDPTVAWSEERFKTIQKELGGFLKKGLFLPKDVVFIPVSAFTGANIKEQVSKDICPWNTSPSLLQYLDSMPAPDRNVNGPFILPISEKYNDLGTMVVGKIESGRIYRDDTLLLMPNKTSVKVSNIYDEVNEELEHAYSGDNIRIRLSGVTDVDVTPGYVLTSPSRPIHTTTRFQAQLAILESKSIICAGYNAVMHIHTVTEEVTLVSLLHYLEAKTGRKSKKPPQFAKTGQQIIALIETTAPVCMEKFADFPQLGRFTLRDEGKTIAIGKVTKIITPRETAAADAEALPDVGGLAIDGATA